MKRLVLNVLIPLLLFVAIFVPRVIALDSHVTADEGRWLERTAKSTAALVHRDWDSTFQREHPGVTTQWAGAIGLLQTMPDFPQKTRADFDTYNQIPDYWPDVQDGITPLRLMVAGRWWTIFFVSLALTLAYFPLARLLGHALSAFSILFAAWSPMAVAFTRYLHPDSLVAVMSLTAFIFFCAWLYLNQRWRELILAGIFMGLAWLSKTPAAALVFAGAGALALELWQSRPARQTPPGGLQPKKLSERRLLPEDHRASWQRLLTGYVVWGVIASATFFLLWPVMWTSPFETFERIYATMAAYAGGHDNPNFFMGKAVDDPGLFFYPVAYLFRTTPATLLGLVVAAIAFFTRKQPFDRKSVRKTAIGMFIFAMAFLLLMTVMGKKFDRYILPTFLALDVIAALGLVALAQMLAGLFVRSDDVADAMAIDGSQHRSGLATAISVLVILIALGPLHAMLTARHYPYYLTYFNPLMGGTERAPEVMFTGWGEGLDQVGAWLDEQPAADTLHVLSWYYYGPLSYYFSGNAIGVQYGSRMPWLDADYVVLYINQVQRDIPTKAAVDFFEGETPVHTVDVAGIEMARVYDLRDIVAQLLASTAPPENLPIPAQWSNLQLTEFKSLTSLPIASALPVEMRWDGESEQELKASLRLFSEDGTLVAQEDRPIRPEIHPEMAVTLFVPPDAIPGPYVLQLMVYDEETFDPVHTEGGQSIVTMTAVELKPLP